MNLLKHNLREALESVDAEASGELNLPGPLGNRASVQDRFREVVFAEQNSANKER